MIHGKSLFPTFKHAITLTEVVRTENIELIDHLHRLRRGEISGPDLFFWGARCIQNLSQHERTQFSGAMTICARNKTVEMINSTRLRTLDSGLVTFRANDVGSWQRDSRHIHKTVFLKTNAPIILQANINVAAGLCNGSRGVIKGFSFPNEPDSYPVTWVEFPDFRGEPILQAHPKLVPITHHKFEQTRNGVTITRWQTPLRLAFAITAHKSQGMSLDRYRFLPEERESAFGMSYVALSRAIAVTSFVIDMPAQTESQLWQRFKLMSTSNKGKETLHAFETYIENLYIQTVTFLDQLSDNI